MVRQSLGLSLLLVACGGSGTSPPADAASDIVQDAAQDASVAPVDAGTCTWDGGTSTPPEPALRTPRWAFEPWISKDISTAQDTYDFVDGFRQRDIPVGAVVLDSPWETAYNTFVPSPTRYPNFGRMVSDMHARGVRVVLWITAFVNTINYDLEPGGDIYRGPAPNLAEGRLCRFFVNEGAVYNWWKGTGASVDFFNPRARAWWHRQQDIVLDQGIDGWKLDFGDSYVTTPTVSTAEGEVPHQRYSEAYYRDFYAYGVERRGADFVTMVRAWDESYQYPGRFFARREHAPVVWMGDNRRDWVGLIDALDHTFRSAQAGYAMLGTDVGGYLDRDDRNLLQEVPFDPDNFARWVAVGAMSPFMQLHGRGNFTPWTVPTRADEIVALYRYWSHLHHALVPWLYQRTEAVYAHNRTAAPSDLRSVVTPLGAGPEQWQGDWRYLLGGDFLVAPVLNGSGRRDVALPAGRWYDWWSLGADPVVGPRTLTGVDTTNIARIPLYLRGGAIVPLRVEHAVLGMGNPGALLTVLVMPPAPGETARDTWDEEALRGEVRVAQEGTTTTVSLPALPRGLVLGVRLSGSLTESRVGTTPLTTRATREALDASPEGVWVDTARRMAWVRLGAQPAAVTVSLRTAAP